MGVYHLVLNVPRYCISFAADYDCEGVAVDYAKELWDALSNKVKMEVMPPVDRDSFFGVYDNNCSEDEWIWQPDTEE